MTVIRDELDSTDRGILEMGDSPASKNQWVSMVYIEYFSQDIRGLTAALSCPFPLFLV